MSESSALEELQEKLRAKKSKEIQLLEELSNESNRRLTQSLSESLKSELNTTSKDIKNTLKSLSSEMHQERQKFIQEEQQMLQQLKKNRIAVEEESEGLMESIKKAKIKTWVAPALVGTSLTIGLLVGTTAASERISEKLLTLEQLEKTIQQTQQTQNRYVVKAWENGIAVRKKPKVWQSKDGLWLIQYEESK